MPEHRRPEEENAKIDVSKPAKPQAEVKAQKQKPELASEPKEPSNKGTKWLEVYLRSFSYFYFLTLLHFLT